MVPLPKNIFSYFPSQLTFKNTIGILKNSYMSCNTSADCWPMPQWHVASTLLVRLEYSWAEFTYLVFTRLLLRRWM